MREYIFTSKRFRGSLRFAYENGLLVQFHCNAKLDDNQVRYFTNNFPFREGDLKHVKGDGNITEVTELTFDMFWDKYGYKRDRVRAKAQWNRTKKEERIEAMAGINRYMYNCKIKNISPVYAERYLKYKRYQDED